MSKILSQKKLTRIYPVVFEAHVALDSSIMVIRSFSDWESPRVTAYLNTAPEINIVQTPRQCTGCLL